MRSWFGTLATFVLILTAVGFDVLAPSGAAQATLYVIATVAAIVLLRLQRSTRAKLPDGDDEQGSGQLSNFRGLEFESMTDSLPLFAWMTDSHGQMNFLNRFGIDYVGRSRPEELMGSEWLQTLHPDDVERTAATWSDAVRTGKPYTIEFRLRRHDGQYRWHRSSATAIRNQHGGIESWFGTCIDIEEQRRLSDRLVQILENISDVFYALDANWRFIYLNKSGEQLSGSSRRDLLGEVIWEKFPEVVGTQFESYYRQAQETGQAVQFTEYYEPFDTWLDVKAFPTTDGIAVFLRDITHQRRAEEQLRQSQRMESIGQLTGGIAHDFNNLLTVIMGNAQIVAELLADHPDGRQLSDMIVQAAERGSNLTQRLLAFARKQALEPRPVDVNRLVAGMESLLRRTLGAHIELELVRGAGLKPAMIDPGLLEDSLLNLCLNARAAMAQGGRLTIETYNAILDADYAKLHEEVAPGHYVVVAVSDTGEGIAPEHLARVFEPFFTARKEGGGTGLGLAMVYGFVKQSGGHVKIYSELNHGTTVRVYLPYTDTHIPVAPASTESRIEEGSEKILLAEDDDAVRQYAERELIRLGYLVITAADGHEALQILESEQHIDLLFTDVMMPGGMNGRELANRAVELRPELKVLYTSGYTENAIVHHGRLDPGVQLLAKPYRRDELARAIRKALGH